MENKIFSKKDYQNLFLNMMKPLEDLYTEGNAGIHCGSHSASYSSKTAEAEGFLRTIWGLGPFFAGGGENKELEKKYLEGIINGTDPKSKYYWGLCFEQPTRQLTVEVPPLAMAIILAPEKFWEPLTKEQKENVANWIKNADKTTTKLSNWYFFAVLANLALKVMGLDYNKEKIVENLKALMTCYRGNGWYSDGPTRNRFEYYIAFAFHFYSLLYAKIMEKDDPENSKLFKERAVAFAKDYIYWFDENGRELVFGRSLTYRFAHLCFWCACVFADVYPFPIEVIKGIIGRSFRYWTSLPITDSKGVLTVGYGYPLDSMAEEYNSFGSPYWAFKSFIILALDDNHKFWSAEEAPLPKLEKLHVMKEPNMIMQRNGDYTVMLASGQQGLFGMHNEVKYSKFAYNSKYAFNIPLSYTNIDASAPDNMLVFEKFNMHFVRKSCIEYKMNDDNSLYSKWSPFEGIIVETTLIPTDNGHIRKHKITSDVECVAYDCGFPTPDGNDEVIGNGEKVQFSTSPNSNLISPGRQKVNGIKYEIKKGETLIETTFRYPR